MYTSVPPHSGYPSGIQGQLLEVTVVSCSKLKDTEWISRQDPYVWIEYGSTKVRTRTCTDGGKNPTFQEKFVFPLIEGLREINVKVWNSNTITQDDFIGSGMVQLQKVLSQGFDDSSWPLQTKTGRHAGEVRLIMHYPNANKPTHHHVPSAPPYASQSAPQAPFYSAPPASSNLHYSSTAPYPPPAASLAPYPPPSVAPAAPYPPPAAAATSPYPPPAATSAYPPYPSYEHSAGAYSQSPYPPQSAPYPPQPHAYPPAPYPPPPQGSSYYPPAGPYPGPYPPPY